MNQTTKASLEIEELADGVRYVLPRRRRRGWAALVWHAAVAFFLYFTFPIFLVWTVVYQSAPWWFLALGLGAALLFFLGGLSNIRNARAILSTPDVAIELRTGRLVIIRQTLTATTTTDIPLADMRRLTVRCLATAEDVPPPAQVRRSGWRWRQWLSTFPVEEMDRAERRQAGVLRYFGTLVLEGEGNAEIALAEEYGRTCLMALAEDVANRIRHEYPQVDVVHSGTRLTPIAAADPRLNRPAQITNIKTDQSADTFVFEVPPPGISYARCVGGAFWAALTLTVAGSFVQILSWPPGPPNLCVLFFMIALLATGIASIRIAVRGFLSGAARIFILVDKAALTMRWHWPIIRRQRAWAAGQIATCLIQQRPTTNSAGKAILTYDLMMLDQAMRGFLLLRDRPEAELEWVAAVLHNELGLGAQPSQPSVPEHTVTVGN
jgi:hypothetical protein